MESVSNGAKFLNQNSSDIKTEQPGVSISHTATTPIKSKILQPEATQNAPSMVNGGGLKSLPNIQPKISSGSSGPFQRQLVPKNEIQHVSPNITGGQQSSVIVPQGIQHVLINGQLYPIIQTANGTHLLIQQPVGQIQQNGGKQVFTAQPIQLANIPVSSAHPIQSPSPNLAQSINKQNTGVVNQHLNSHPTNQLNNSITPNQPNLSPAVINQPINPDAQTTVISTGTAGILPNVQNDSTIQASGAPSTGPSPPSTQITGPPSSQTTAPLPNQPVGVPNNVNPSSMPVTVSPQTQQLLARIQNQIEGLKPKTESDPTARSSLQQLQHIQQQILNEIRNQMQIVQQKAFAAQPLANQPAMQPVQPANQFIIQPAAVGESAMTNSNISALISMFMNVKVSNMGNQAYNIQLTEDQKRFMIDKMCKMTAEQQHVFVREQQTQILSQALGGNQALLPQPPPVPGQVPPNQQKAELSTPPQPLKPAGKSRSRRRPTPRPKAADDSANRPTLVEANDDSSQSSGKTGKTPARRPRPSNFSSKRIAERMLAQIQKDQEVLLKPGGHKRAFLNRNQLSERLLRYHIYYTDDTSLYSRKLHEAELFESIADKMVLKKEEMIQQFRQHLWEETRSTSRLEEDLLIAELLLEDEKSALEFDRELESNDIGKFKAIYKKPEVKASPVKSPIPSPKPSTSLPDMEDTSNNSRPSKSSYKSTKNSKVGKGKAKTTSRRHDRGRNHCRPLKTIVADVNEYKEEITEDVNDNTSENVSATLTDETKALDKVPSAAETAKESPYSMLNENEESVKSTPAANNYSNSDIEDDIIDIGDPPTPPRNTPPHITSPALQDKEDSPPLSSPIGEPYTSSPAKYFSICSETVVAQSEQVDNSYDQQNSRYDYNVSYSGDVPSEGNDTLDVQRSDERFSPNYLPQDGMEVASPASSSGLDDEAPDNQSDEGRSQKAEETGVYGNYTDDEVMSTDDEITVENGHVNDGTDQDTQDKVIAPIRINKRHLENYSLNNQDNKQYTTGMPPIKIKLSEPVPPPIKLRIKRDVNDKWEAASSVSSYIVGESTYDSSSSHSAEYSQDEDQCGGVTVNWDDGDDDEDDNDDDVDNDDDEEVYESNEEQQNGEEDESLQSDQDYQHEFSATENSNDAIDDDHAIDDEDSIPFESYSSFRIQR